MKKRVIRRDVGGENQGIFLPFDEILIREIASVFLKDPKREDEVRTTLLSGNVVRTKNFIYFLEE